MVGCGTQKALLDLPSEQRTAIRFNPNVKQSPRVLYASEGVRTAREIGGVIGLTVAAGIEHSTNAYGSAATVLGTFEAAMAQERFVKRLSAAGLDPENGAPGAQRVEFRVETVGLREVERERFAPFASAVGRLYSSDGKVVWHAHAKSTGSRPRAVAEFREKPDLYREEFEEVANDIANQLVEGPVRPITY